MKIDRHIKGLSDRINAVAFLKSNLEKSTTEDNDDYYLSINLWPPRFEYYYRLRSEQPDLKDTITQDELDYYLKKKLRIPPEERYYHNKRNWFFHELSYLHQTVDENGKAVDIIRESGCGHFSNTREEERGCCVPECRYYPATGRIEDGEVIQEHKEALAKLRIVNIDIPD